MATTGTVNLLNESHLRRWPMCRGQKLDPAFAEKFLNFIVAEVIRHHERIADSVLTSDGTSSS
jgi:hypothetical protein